VPDNEADLDGDGFVHCNGWVGSAALQGGDCDEAASGIHPGAREWCDEVDSDCDGDFSDGTDLQLWLPDRDGDGWGDADEPGIESCAQPSEGTVANALDCDDANDEIHPGAAEWCDEVDHDCNGDPLTPVPTDATVVYQDSDGDQFGLESQRVRVCVAGEHQTETPGDCDDHDQGVHPLAEESWYDGVDQNCDGRDDYDQDLDGYAAWDHGGSDCDDTNPNVVPPVGAEVDCDLAGQAWVLGGGGCACNTGAPGWAGWGPLVGLMAFMRRRSTA
jgi:hypothetical protein